MLAGGQGACPVLFAGATALTQAATANSYLSRCLDWNDTYIGKNGGHPSDIIAGAMTTGAWAGKNGDRILRAIAAGTHAMMDLCDSADAMSRGWDHATYVGLAATIVSAEGLVDVDFIRDHTRDFAAVRAALRPIAPRQPGQQPPPPGTENFI